MRHDRLDNSSLYGYDMNPPPNVSRAIAVEMRVWMEVEEEWGEWQHTTQARLIRLHGHHELQGAPALRIVLAGNVLTTTVDKVTREWRVKA